MSKKIKKVNDAKSMIEYTSRDYGQEYIMKKKMIRAIVLSVILCIALAVFIGLYIDETKKFQEKCRSQFITCLEKVNGDIDSYTNADGDLDFRYRRLVADMNSVCSFAFLMKDFEEHQKSVNELYTVLLKYPEQMKGKMTELKTAVEDMKANLDKGFEEADAIVDSINKKGY